MLANQEKKQRIVATMYRNFPALFSDLGEFETDLGSLLKHLQGLPEYYWLASGPPAMLLDRASKEPQAHKKLQRSIAKAGTMLKAGLQPLADGNTQPHDSVSSLLGIYNSLQEQYHKKLSAPRKSMQSHRI